jgi:hydrogenase/urease accessory protein HupE
MTTRANAAWRAGVALCVGVLLRPSDAAAHLVTTGMGPVYDGIGHLLLTPEDLVPVLALALFAGLRGAAQGRCAMFLLPAAWLAGGLLGLRVSATPAFPVPALSFLILGALVAADLRMPANGVAGLAVILGLVHGVLNGTALRQGAGGRLVRPRFAGLGIRRLPGTAVDPDSGPGGRKLGRGQRAPAAGLGVPDRVTQANGMFNSLLLMTSGTHAAGSCPHCGERQAVMYGKSDALAGPFPGPVVQYPGLDQGV